jgi:hypothetical protein
MEYNRHIQQKEYFQNFHNNNSKQNEKHNDIVKPRENDRRKEDNNRTRDNSGDRNRNSDKRDRNR